MGRITKRKVFVYAICFIGFIALASQVYYLMFFDVKRYILREVYKGDRQEFLNDIELGELKFCKHYVRRHYAKYDVVRTYFYRIKDGRPYKAVGRSCEKEVVWPEFNLFGENIFDLRHGDFRCAGQGPPHLECPQNCSSLECAIRYKEADSIGRLIRAGVNLNEPVGEPRELILFMPRLYTRSYRKGLEDVKVLLISLLENGADPNIRNEDGATPLNYYISRDSWVSEDIVRIYLDHGADPYIKDNEGKSALDIAREKGLSDIVQMMQEKH